MTSHFLPVGGYENESWKQSKCTFPGHDDIIVLPYLKKNYLADGIFASNICSKQAQAFGNCQMQNDLGSMAR